MKDTLERHKCPGHREDYYEKDSVPLSTALKLARSK